ncbi:hypothetical protein O0L34_g11264 [Tuta absoluta]|nr:hypothetical protein O0L34_g11264 [Tuta absoluta]
MNHYMCLGLLLFSLRCYANEFEERIGNPDDTGKIERPCPTYDLNCIRVFFQNHAHCKKAFGPVPDPMSRPQTNLYLPRINISISTTDLEVTGLNGRVEEFYINRYTDRLVIAVDFQKMTQSTNNVFFKFHRRVKEPVVTRGTGSITYSSLIITAVIPKLDDLRLHDAECTTYAGDPVSLLELTPDAGVSSDPQTTAAFADFLTDMPRNIQEFFLTDSAYYVATYIQYTICDFGLLLT